MPTTVDSSSDPTHESILRSYWIVVKTKDLLQRGTPASVVLDLIEEMQAGEACTYNPKEEN